MALTEREADRYLRLKEWAVATFEDPWVEGIFLGEGYSPDDRLGKLEDVYSLWVRENPEDEMDDLTPKRSDSPGLV